MSIWCFFETLNSKLRMIILKLESFFYELSKITYQSKKDIFEKPLL